MMMRLSSICTGTGASLSPRSGLGVWLYCKGVGEKGSRTTGSCGRTAFWGIVAGSFFRRTDLSTTVPPILLATDAANTLADARAALDAVGMAAKPCSFPGPAPSDLAYYAMAIVDSAGAVEAPATFARRWR